MNDASSSTHAPRHLGWIIGLALVPVLYVLMIGPAFRIYDQSPPLIRKAIDVFYAPLNWFDGRFTPDWINDYVEWWYRW